MTLTFSAGRLASLPICRLRVVGVMVALLQNPERSGWPAAFRGAFQPGVSMVGSAGAAGLGAATAVAAKSAVPSARILVLRISEASHSRLRERFGALGPAP